MAIERLARLRQGRAQRRPGTLAGLLQLLEVCFGLRRIRLHLLDRGIDVSAFCGCHLRCFLMERVGRLTPGLHLGGGYIPECGLLLLDLLAESVEVGFDLGFETVPL